MNYFWDKHNLFYKISASVLIILHLFTFGPIKDALAFSASSASYKMTSGLLNEGGKDRRVTNTKLLLHCDGSDGSTNFTDERCRQFTLPTIFSISYVTNPVVWKKYYRNS